jgi:hypothetical protein
MEWNAKRFILATAAGVAAGAWASIAASAGPASTPPDLTGVWIIENAPVNLRTIDGSSPPLRAEGQVIYSRNQERLKQHDFSVDLTRDRCASPGMPRMMTLPNAIELFQRPSQLTVLFEWNHLYRLVNLRSEPKAGPYPLAIGTSNGHWEDRTLVVDTTGITENTLLDSSGLPHSDQLSLTEHIRLLPNGRLEDVITVHDAKMFERDWSFKLTFKKTGAKGVEEDVCLDRLESGHPALAGDKR